MTVPRSLNFFDHRSSNHHGAEAALCLELFVGIHVPLTDDASGIAGDYGVLAGTPHG